MECARFASAFFIYARVNNIGGMDMKKFLTVLKIVSIVILIAVVIGVCVYVGKTQTQEPEDNGNDGTGTGEEVHTHSLSEWEVVEPYCTTVGSQLRFCSSCDFVETQNIHASGHEFSKIVSWTDEHSSYVSVACEICGELFDDGVSGVYFEDDDVIRLNDCEEDFSIDVYCSKGEEYLNDTLRIYDAVLYDPNAEDNSNYEIAFVAESIEENVYRIKGKDAYTYDMLYKIVATDDIAFLNYPVSTIEFSVYTEDFYEVEYADGIINLSDMEAGSPGYYPYGISYDSENDLYTLTLSKLGDFDDSFVGKVLQLGDPDDIRTIIYGKIQTVSSDGSGAVITMSTPNLEDVYVSMQSSGGYVEAPEIELTDEQREEYIHEFINSEGFLSAMTSANVAADLYAEEHGMQVETVGFDIGKIDFKVEGKAEGNKVSAFITISYKLEIPVTHNGNSVGNIVFNISASNEVSVTADAKTNVRIEKLGDVANVIYNYKSIYISVSGTLLQKSDFSISSTLDVNYSAEEKEYVINPNTKTIHDATCSMCVKYAKSSKYRISYTEAVKRDDYLKNECQLCKPFTGASSGFVLNTSTGMLHRCSCANVKKIAANNAKAYCMYPTGAGVTENCSVCEPEKNIISLDKLAQNGFNSGSWKGVYDLIKKSVADSGSGKSVFGFDANAVPTAAMNVYGVYIPLYIKPHFDFKLDATFSFDITSTCTDRFYATVKYDDNQKKFVCQGPEYVKGDPKIDYNFDLRGDAHAELGVEAVLKVTIQPVQNRFFIAIMGEMGFYGDLTGVIHSDSKNGTYYAAYAEIGAYYDLEYDVTVDFSNVLYFLKYDPEPKSFFGEKQYVALIKSKDSKVYYAFSNAENIIDLGDKSEYELSDSILQVEYLDLKKDLEAGTAILNWNERYQYAISYYVVDQNNKKVDWCIIDNGTLKVTSSAPSSFTATVYVTVTDKQVAKSFNEYFTRGQSNGAAFCIQPMKITVTYSGGQVSGGTSTEKELDKYLIRDRKYPHDDFIYHAADNLVNLHTYNHQDFLEHQDIDIYAVERENEDTYISVVVNKDHPEPTTHSHFEAFVGTEDGKYGILVDRDDYIIFDFDLKSDAFMDGMSFYFLFRESEGKDNDRYPGDPHCSAVVYPFRDLDMNVGEWYHFTLVGDVANNALYVYQNNRLVAEYTNNGLLSYRDAVWGENTYFYGLRYNVSHDHIDPVIAGTGFSEDNNYCRIYQDIEGLELGTEDTSDWTNNIYNSEYASHGKVYKDGSDDYNKFSAPSNSGDYAYWDGKKVVKSSSTTTEEVKWMQAALNFCINNEGLDSEILVIDGSFGPATKNATLKFQDLTGITQDGKFGPKTIAKMKSVLKDGAVSFDESKNVSSVTKAINVDMALLEEVGYQTEHGPGACYALAYCHTILDGKAHQWTEYSNEGYVKKLGRYGYTASWVKGDATKKYAKSEKALFKVLYESINDSKPVVLHVSGNGWNGHYVVVVGYQDVTDVNSLSAANFLIIDSDEKAFHYGVRSMTDGDTGYSVHSDKAYAVINDSKSGSATTSTKQPESYKDASVAIESVIDKILTGDLDIYSDYDCTKEVSLPVDEKMSMTKLYYVKSKTTKSVISGKQCYIYANAVYNKLFNEWVGHAEEFSHSKIVIGGGSNKVSYEKFCEAGVLCGAYMRTTTSKNGTYIGDKGHSLIIVSYDEIGINYLEGNGDGAGMVRITTQTWSEFNKAQLSGRSRYISHVVQPTDAYYYGRYGEDRVEAAIQWALEIANDNTHGYSQKSRNGPEYDCSSLVAAAFRSAGFGIEGNVYTGNMKSVFEKLGFKVYKKGEVELQRGDILLRPVKGETYGHTEIYLGDDQVLGAHGDFDGKTGDGNGDEISVRKGKQSEFYSKGYYTYILRYEG